MTPALAAFESTPPSATRELLTTLDARLAAHFAAGCSRDEAAALAQAERAIAVSAELEDRWGVLSDQHRRARRTHVMIELEHLLSVLEAAEDASDSEALWEDVGGNDSE
ncbi:hypothetical protein R3P38DRAFT_3195881 [Favolaschia claudopus]|uniref:Uncharacterized protein n=1 Tax=Favolaschia claudopus TaxID=2862362 RepID=A0AAW0BAA3_9AGAR